MEKAIKKAIEGGYDMVSMDKLTLEYKELRYHSGELYCSIEQLFLDPLFWQALGKACGWYMSYDLEPEHVLDAPFCWCGVGNTVENGVIITVHQDKTWRGAWHSFIDHLAEGKDAESFFNELLNA